MVTDPVPTDPDALLAALDPEQRRAVEAVRGPVRILAGAGTGKTRTLAHRIAYGVSTGAYDPTQVLALTFTTRAAEELRGRLTGLGANGVQVRTFHAAALAQLGHFWPRVAGGPAPQLVAIKGPLLGQAAEALRIRVDAHTLRDVAAEIEWRKVSGLSLAQYALRERPLPPGMALDRMLALHERYERLKDERRRIDFEDVLLACAGMLADEDAIADEVRAQYRVFLVDEYQDVSPIQQTLLELWLGQRSDLCVVGDASQTIYSFAGATNRYLLDFEQRWPRAELVQLERNHRSAAPILDVANQLMRGRPGALELLPAAPTEPPAGGGAARAHRGPRATTVVSGPVEFESDRLEAAGVADAVAAEIAAGIRPESIAILYRINAQAAIYAAALADRGISARELGGTPFFEHDAVRRAVLEIGSFARQPGADRAPLFQAVSDAVRSAGWTAEAPSAGGAVRERWELLSALVDLADAAEAGTTLPQFAAELARRAQAAHEPPVAAVVLSTLHGAKGLEWDAVHLVGVAEGLLPVAHAKDDADVEEERRLLYVGVTRARRRLELSWARQGAQGRRREPSRFLVPGSTGTRGGGRLGSR